MLSCSVDYCFFLRNRYGIPLPAYFFRVSLVSKALIYHELFLQLPLGAQSHQPYLVLCSRGYIRSTNLYYFSRKYFEQSRNLRLTAPDILLKILFADWIRFVRGCALRPWFIIPSELIITHPTYNCIISHSTNKKRLNLRSCELVKMVGSPLYLFMPRISLPKSLGNLCTFPRLSQSPIIR